MRNLSDSGFILKSKPFQENDSLLFIFCQEQGLKTFKASGVKNSKKGWKANFLLFSEIKFEFIASFNLSKIIKIEKQKKFTLSNDFKVFNLASFCSEVILKILPENQKSIRIFSLLKETFSLLKAKDLINKKNLPFIFFIKLLSILGLCCDLSHCCSCHQKFIKDQNVFWKYHGEVLCQNCQKNFNNVQLLSFLQLKILNFWQKKDLSKSLLVSISSDDIKKFIILIDQEMKFFTHRPLHTLQFLS